MNGWFCLAIKKYGTNQQRICLLKSEKIKCLVLPSDNNRCQILSQIGFFQLSTK